MKIPGCPFSRAMFIAAVVLLPSGLVVFASTSAAENLGAPQPRTEFLGDVDHLAFQTVERRQNTALRTLLRDGLSPNLRAADGTTLLMYAALHGDTEGVRILLEAGADPNANNHKGATALIWGAGDLNKVKLLVGNGADIDAKSKDGMSPLATAAAQPDGGGASVAYLLEQGANASADAGGFWGMGALGVASYSGNLDAVKALISQLEANGEPPNDLSSELHGAVDQGHLEIFNYLLTKSETFGANLNSLDDRLADALGHQNLTMARQLIQRGARASGAHVVAYPDGEMEEILLKLLELGVDVNHTAWRDHTALDFARMRGHTNLVKLLVEAGAMSGNPPKQKEIPNRSVRLSDTNLPEIVSESVERGLSLLLRSSDRFLRSRESCNSCHHQDLPAISATIARSRGIKVAEDSLERIHRRQIERWQPQVAGAYEVKAVNPDTPKTMGYILWGRSVQGLPLDPVTKALVWHLAAKQQVDGSWRGHGPRMPMQDGAHMATALGLRVLKMYPLPGRSDEFGLRVQRARDWLKNTPAQIHTHQAFRLLGLAWAEANRDVLHNEIEALLSTQKEDGGWSQLPNLESDAWATGLALLALNAAGLETTHEAYVRGMEFLVNTQFDDGSWFVRSRSRPSQPHFDSHFPHGWHQWISAAGTALASASLALALDPVEVDAIPFTPAEEILRSINDDATSEEVQLEDAFVFIGTPTIDFARDIQPLLEESCLDCHSGDKPKGNFKVTDRASLIGGGESGVATFVAGRGSESQLIRHVTDQVEDMEMPPLRKRRTYPALSPAQVQTLATWIDEGAAWPEGLELDD